MQYFLYILLIPFLYLNFRIVLSDIKEKIIPNKYLLYLIAIIPFYYILFFGFNLNLLNINNDFNIWFFLIQIFLTFLVSFLLYYYGVWSPGDAKYLLVLSLFIPNIGIIPFIGNIAIITMIYLMIYFLYFYLIKNIFNSKYRKSLFGNIYKDSKGKALIFFQDSDGKIYKKTVIKKLVKSLIAFLIVFVSFRLLRLYLYSSLLSIGSETDDETRKTGRIGFIVNYLEEYNVYIILIGVFLFLLFIFYIRRILRFIRKHITNKLKNFLEKKYKISSDIVDFTFLMILALLLASFILVEYFKDPYEIGGYLKIIFTYYIILMIIARILIYTYKITFQIAEQDFIKIKDLKEGNIVDKNYLVKIFGTQKSLSNKETQKGLLYPSPKDYFKNIDNPIDKETSEKLKKIYSIISIYHKEEKTPNYSENDNVKILKTFAFGLYIFIGFILTIFLNDYLFKSFIDFMSKLIIKN